MLGSVNCSFWLCLILRKIEITLKSLIDDLFLSIYLDYAVEICLINIMHLYVCHLFASKKIKKEEKKGTSEFTVVFMSINTTLKYLLYVNLVSLT